jgi:AsmA protein
MNKVVKYGLFGAGAVVAVALMMGAYLAATFDPNDYKAEIIKAVKQTRQRTLHLDGDIKLRLFPYIGASLERVSLSEFNSEQQFASARMLKVSLELMPLLRRELVVDDVIVDGLLAHVVRHKDGTSNIDDLISRNPKPESGKQPVKFDIASVLVKNTSLSYLDEATGAAYEIDNLKLDAGRIAQGVPTRIALSVHAKGNRPALDIDTQLAAMLTLDADGQAYRLADMDLRVNGSALDIVNLKMKANGDIGVQLAKEEFSANKFELNASGVKAGSPFEAALNLPALLFSGEKLSGSKLTFNARLDSGNIVAGLSLPDISGSAQSFNVSKLLLDLSVQMPDQSFKIRLSSPVSGNLDARRFLLSNAEVAVSGVFDKLPGQTVNSKMKGKLEVDAKRETVQANLSGGLLQSRVTAKAEVSDFANPYIRFDADADKLDADLYLPKKTNRPEQPMDLSFLRKLNLEGSLHIGQLKAENIRLGDLRLNVRARRGLVNISPLSASLYKGSMNGSISVNAAATPVIAVNQKFAGIDVAALTKDAADFDMLEGRGNVAMNLSMQGDMASRMKKTLDGNLSLTLVDGAIRGINVARTLRDAKGALTGAQTQTANRNEKTDFSELKASFKISNGVAHNEDLSLKSPLLRVAGSGDIDVGLSRMNYLARATLARTLEGQGGLDKVGGITVPLRIAGPFDDLKYTLDFGAMVNEAAKQKVEAAKQELKTKAQDQLKNSLKGLFR